LMSTLNMALSNPSPAYLLLKFKSLERSGWKYKQNF
jgi:hypothetical protein